MGRFDVFAFSWWWSINKSSKKQIQGNHIWPITANTDLAINQSELELPVTKRGKTHHAASAKRGIGLGFFLFCFFVCSWLADGNSMLCLQIKLI